MTTGERIKLIRSFKGLTQKQLGEMAGIHEVALRKYELNKVLPREEQLEKIAAALCVPLNSLIDIKINTDSDILPLLFAIDEAFEFQIIEADGKPAIQFTYDSLNRFLRDWQSMKELIALGTQSEENYKIWKAIRPGTTKVYHDGD